MTITTQQANSTFENVLFESPTLAASNAATVNLSSYGSAAAFAQYLSGTAEFGITAQVIRYYADALGRIPSGSEISYYVSLVENGSTAAGIVAMTPAEIAAGTVPQASLSMIATYFAASQEFQKDFGLTAADLVAADQQATMINDFYSNILGRTASASEVQYYENALNNGFKPSDLVQFFSNSPEFLSDASAKIRADVAAYANAIAAGTATSTTAISSQPLVTPLPTYALVHDAQSTITEGSTETFTLITAHVATGTILDYTLAGVTASEVVGGSLSGTVTVGANGEATLAVTLASGAGQGLAGDLTATVNTTAGGTAVAASSVALSETTVSGIVTLGNLGGGNSGTAPLAENDSGVIVGFSGIGGGGSGMFRSGNTGLDHAFVFENGVMTDIGTLPGYGWQAEAWAVNDSDEVVGWSLSGGTTGTKGGHAFLWANGAMTDLGTLPGNTISQAHGINNFGQIVGQSGNDAFLWQPTAANATTGTMIDLGSLPGYTYAMGMGINASGEVVGYAINSGSSMVAFLWTPGVTNGTSGTMVNLGALAGDSNVQPWQINASGAIVGTSTSGAGVNDAWIWTPNAVNSVAGIMSQLVAIGGAGLGANAYSINASGEVAGMSQTAANSIYHATIWENGTAIDLNSLLASGSGWVLTEADSINDNGLVSGQGLHNDTYATFEMALTSSTPSHGATVELVGLSSAHAGIANSNAAHG